MNQTILFSPLGGTDPMSNSNFRDGSMLHICRVYKPTKVILYMSAEIVEKHLLDNRYNYCLDKLEEHLGVTFQREIIERKSLKNVQEFDYFYKEFRSIIKNIYKTMDETDTLLINISSGTPAMKSGLLVLQTLSEFPCRMIQVTTPDGKMNEHIHKDFDVETAWELNEDNNENFENRCSEPSCPTLSKIKKEEIIKKHIAVFDYRAALSIADTMSKQDTLSYYNLLQMAERRLLLDFNSVDKLRKKENLNFLPIAGTNKRKCFEYALNLQVKLLRGEYTDFIRAITPLLLDLLEMALKYKCQLNINDYCKYKKRKIRCWDEQKLMGSNIYSILDNYYRHNSGCCFNCKSPLSSLHLSILIQNLTDDQKLIELAVNLRNVEEKIRNMAAHEIVSITENTIVTKTGFTGVQIMDQLKHMFMYTEISPDERAWESYSNMNSELIRRIG